MDDGEYKIDDTYFHEKVSNMKMPAGASFTHHRHCDVRATEGNCVGPDEWRDESFALGMNHHSNGDLTRSASKPGVHAAAGSYVLKNSTLSADVEAAVTDSDITAIGSDGEDNLQENKRFLNRRFVLAICAVIAIASIALAVVLLTRSGNSEESAGAPVRESPPNDDPTESPPEIASRKSEVTAYLSTLSVDGDFTDPDSAQSKALVWIADSDPAGQRPMDDPRFLQRYAMAVLYHSTIGDDWSTKDLWLTEADECLWHGATCTNYDKGDTGPTLNVLEKIELTDNNLIGSLPAEIFFFHNLTHLAVEDNSLTGTIPSQLGVMSNLETISLSYNEFTDEIPTFLGNLENLRTMDFSGNRLDGIFPKQITDLSKLEILGLKRNNLAGYIPEEIGKLSKLEYLDLTSNKFIGKIPSDVSVLTLMTSLRLRSNFLTGTIPTNIGLLTNLELLDLSGNRLNGTVPNQVSNLIKLEKLELSDNKLSGSIFEGIEKLINLESLMMFFNNLNGTLPAKISNLTSLVTLNLNGNDLSGTVPEAFSRLSSINTIELRDNILDGTVPESLCDLFRSTSNNPFGGRLTVGGSGTIVCSCCDA